ncbi:MAG: class I SAM-dependent methyltransferase [Oligoflexia bacterium]|nr:class I SAM-dependent methyltransferase [Oligoflexia bacterium]
MKEYHKNDFDGNLVYGGKTYHGLTGRIDVITDVNESDEFEKHNISDKDLETLKQCPMCNGEEINEFIRKKRLKVYRCNSCDFGFLNPRVKKESSFKLYDQSSRYESLYLNETSNKLDKIKFQYVFQLVKRFISPQSVLDIGSSSGIFLNTCAEEGVQIIHGIEADTSQIKRSPFYQKNFHIETSMDLDLSKKYNNLELVTMFDVLEHIIDFKKTLTEIHLSLAKQGIFAIIVPNFYSLASRIIRDKSPTFNIEHTNYFSMKNLIPLLETLGFEIVHKETVISEISNIKNYLEFNDPYFAEPKNEQWTNFLTPEWIHENLLGSRLFVIARKKQKD